MKLHEYQAKSLLSSYGVPLLKGVVVSSVKEAGSLYQTFPPGRLILKAQVLTGGRGKVGGIQTADSPEEIFSKLSTMLGTRLATAQTGAQSVLVQKVLIEQAAEIDRECYLGVTIDRSRSLPVILTSPQGGVEIEEVAAKDPTAIVKEYLDPRGVLSQEQSKKLFQALGLSSSLKNPFRQLLQQLSRCFLEKDLSLLEINPLAVTKKGVFLVLDCKMTVDENALFRHPDLASLRDPTEENPSEQLAWKLGINYIKLDGTIGCLVNGAGLAMATMDVIKLHGGEPANFLDVGGGASLEQVREAYKILLSDEKVRAVLVNIFGGIMKCDLVAEALVGALKTISLNVPLVIRLEGTNVTQGRKILQESKLSILSAETMDEAAEKVVKAARIKD